MSSDDEAELQAELQAALAMSVGGSADGSAGKAAAACWKLEQAGDKEALHYTKSILLKVRIGIPFE